jgi:hypothetical protein
MKRQQEVSWARWQFKKNSTEIQGRTPQSAKLSARADFCEAQVSVVDIWGGNSWR